MSHFCVWDFEQLFPCPLYLVWNICCRISLSNTNPFALNKEGNSIQIKNVVSHIERSLHVN
jgi:hypothetical protein